MKQNACGEKGNRGDISAWIRRVGIEVEGQS